MYLHRPLSKNSAYHLFDGVDTECRMWSTGGLKKKHYATSEERPNKRLCHMCAVNLSKRCELEEEQLEHLRSILA